MKSKRIFQPNRTKFLHNIAIKDEKFREKLAKVELKNRVLPKENELFTSFLARNATLNFLQTSTFINKYFPEYKNWFLSRDLDVLSDEKFFNNFANRFNIDIELLNKTSLKTYTGYLNEIIYENSRNALISPIKIKGLSNKLNGLKYCPLCLQEENYFKKEWRLSFYIVCPKHNTIMQNRCPQCGEPLTITRRKNDIEEFNCWNCGFVFKEAPVEFVNKNSKSVEMLTKAINILNKGWFEFNDNIYYSISYFKVVKHLSKLIYNRGFRENYTLLKELEYLDIELPDINLTSGRFMEDFIEVKEALVIFTTIFEILENSKNLISFIKTNKIPIYELKKDFIDKTFFYDNIIWQFYKQLYSPPYNEVKSAIKWMIKNNIPINWNSLSEIFGVYLDKRKRPELIELIIKNKKGLK
jgi:Zn ribbon nucleic-acid-binding protein